MYETHYCLLLTFGEIVENRLIHYLALKFLCSWIRKLHWTDHFSVALIRSFPYKMLGLFLFLSEHLLKLSLIAPTDFIFFKHHTVHYYIDLLRLPLPDSPPPFELGASCKIFHAFLMSSFDSF